MTRLRKLKIQDEIFSLEKKNNDNKTGKLTVLACTPLYSTHCALYVYNISAIASYVDSNGHRIHPSIVSSDKSAFRPIQHEKNSEKFHAASERLAQEQSSQSPTKRVRRRSFSDSEVSLNGLDGQDWPFVPEKLLLTKIVFRIEKEKRRVIQPSLGLIMTH